MRVLSLLALTLAGSPGRPAAAGLAPAARARMVASPRVGGEVVAGLEAAGSVRVMVAFALPAGRRAREMSRGERARAVAAARAGLLASLPPGSFTVRRAFDAVEAVAGDASPAAILALLERADVVRIDVDAPGGGNLTQALPIMHITDVNALGFTGAGVTTAVIDSGVDVSHPDLADSIVGQRCFCSTGCCPGGGTTGTGAADDNGHGTNVTGIITGNGHVAPAGGAPDAAVVAIKVLDQNARFCCASDVIAALDYVIASHPEVKVVNMSLGTDVRYSGTCDAANAVTMAFASAIDTLRAQGTLAFVSSGNDASPSTMEAPACVANAIAVGATWDQNVGPQTFLGCTDATTAIDQITCFTDSDPALDLVAEGAYITSTGLGGGISTYGGTSQAAPMAAACAADLLQAVPAVAPDALEAALETSPTHPTDAKNGLSFPRLDCLAALQALAPLPTTTTVPCAPSGAAAALCVLGAFPPAACASASLPRAIGAQVGRARTALDAAEGAPGVPRMTRLLAKARTRLARVRKLARQAGRRATVPPGCASALDVLFADALVRAR
jgi:subtilisin family serine protease